jgi:hypothetical protein
MVDYQAVIDDLERKRQQMNARFDAAVAAIKQVLILENSEQPALPGIAKEPEPSLYSYSFQKPYAGLGIVEAAAKYLANAAGPVPNVELAKALEAGGFQHRSKSFPNTLNSVLRRRAIAVGDFRKEPKGWSVTPIRRGIALRGVPEAES